MIPAGIPGTLSYAWQTRKPPGNDPKIYSSHPLPVSPLKSGAPPPLASSPRPEAPHDTSVPRIAWRNAVFGVQPDRAERSRRERERERENPGSAGLSVFDLLLLDRTLLICVGLASKRGLRLKRDGEKKTRAECMGKTLGGPLMV